jgi:hypothetical protein
MKTLNRPNLTVYFTASFGFLAAALTVSLSFLAIEPAHAHTHHTQDVCSVEQPAVCAHLGYDKEPNTADAWGFMLHFQSPQLDPSLLSQVAVKLWMDMGHHSHGSSPVSLTEKSQTHYLVEDAYFPMSGPWQVKVSFQYEGKKAELIVPVEVEKGP